MITVTGVRDVNMHALYITGHANMASRGNDIICAAASMLAYALVGMLKLCEVKKCCISLVEGNTKIVVYSHSDVVHTAFMQTLIGFLILAENHSKHVQVNQTGFFEGE